MNRRDPDLALRARIETARARTLRWLDAMQAPDAPRGALRIKRGA